MRAILEYCSVIWSGTAKSHSERIERVQHKFLLWLNAHVHRSSQSLAYDALLTRYSFIALEKRRCQHDMVFLASIFRHSIDCDVLRASFGLSAPVRSTRQLSLFHVPYGRVETVKRSLFVRLPGRLNVFLRKCPEIDVLSDSIGHIKSGIKKYVRHMHCL